MLCIGSNGPTVKINNFIECRSFHTPITSSNSTAMRTPPPPQPSLVALAIFLYHTLTSNNVAVAFVSTPTHSVNTQQRFLPSSSPSWAPLTSRHAFLPDLQHRFRRNEKHAPPSTTESEEKKTLQKLDDPISSLLITRDRKKLADAEEEWEEQDFLLAEIRPKELTHERDFFRVNTRVQAWDEYVIVSILCTSICYSTLTNYAMNPDHAGIFLYEVVVRTATQLVAGLAVLCGIYSTMVFSVSILYGKTALGLEQDPQFDNFLDSTIDIRKRAFWCFNYALGLFTIMVVLVLVENLPLVVHIPVALVLPAALFVFYRDWDTLTSAAEEVFEDD